jgi:hypothetical protein
VDRTTRRITGIGLALTIVATVYAVSGDFVKAGFAVAGVLFSLLWGFWPELRRRNRGIVPGGVSVEVRVDQAVFRPKDRLSSGREIESLLDLRLLIYVFNDSDLPITVRPVDPSLVRVIWGRTVRTRAEVHAQTAIAPTGRIADYEHFPEGQHTIPAKSEKAHYFFFQAVLPTDSDDFLDRNIRLALTVRLPEPRRFTVPLPPVKRNFMQTANPAPSKASEQGPPS